MVRELIAGGRRMARRPRLAIAMVVLLALPCTAATAFFGIVDRLWWRPLDVAEPGALASVWEQHATLPDTARITSLGLLHAMIAEAESDRGSGRRIDAAASRPWRPVWADSTGPRSLDGAYVTPGFFRTLGVDPRLGRGFVAADADAAAEPVVVIGDRFWRRALGADPDVIGRRLDLGRKSVTIIGVLPPRPLIGEPLVWGRPEVWAPLPDETVAPYDQRYYRVLVRWSEADGRAAPLAALRDRWTARAAAVATEQPAAFRDWRLRIEPVDQLISAPYRPALVAVAWVMGLLLVASCANVAILRSAGADERAGELAVRCALGARRRHLVRQMILESLAITSAASGLGWLLSHGVLVLVTRFSNDERLGSLFDTTAGTLGLAGRGAVVAGALALTTAVLFGLVPALRAWRQHVVDGGRRVIGASGRWHRWLLRVELAIAIVLVAIAGLIGTSFAHLVRVDPGFGTVGVETVELRIPRQASTAMPASVRLAAVVEAVEASPRVVSAGLVDPLPMSGRAMGVDAHTPQHPDPVRVGLRGIDPGLMATLDIPLVDGRHFAATDAATGHSGNGASVTPVLVSRGLARQLWPDRGAVGRELRLTWGPGSYRVVGVVGDIRHVDLATPPEPAVWLPLDQVAASTATLVVQTRSGIEGAMLRNLIRAIDPALLIDSIRPIAERVAETHWRQRVVALALAVLAVLGLVLAIFGTWAVIALDISKRRRAIGVRLAIGADPAGLIRDLMRSIGRDAALGVALGVGLVLLVGKPLGYLLFDTSPAHPLVLATASAGLMALALAVTWLAAGTIRSVDPAELLRDDADSRGPV